MTDPSPTVIDPLSPTTELPEMTPAELKAMREYLGLSTAWIAEHLVIGERRLQRMESGQEQIPAVVVELIDAIQAETADLVKRMSATYRRQVKASAGDPVLLPTFRTDQYSQAAGLTYPSRWHRHLAARIADSCPGAIPTYVENTTQPHPSLRSAKPRG